MQVIQIVLFCFAGLMGLIGFFLMFRRKYRESHLNEYKEVRDETIEKEDVVEESSSSSINPEFPSEFSISGLIGGAIVVLIGTYMLPIIQEAVNTVNSTELGGSAATLINMTTILWVVGVIGAGVVLALKGLGITGLLGDDSSDKEVIEKNEYKKIRKRLTHKRKVKRL